MNSVARVSVLLALCAAALLPGLGRLTVIHDKELRVILPARTMAEGGSWLIPEYMGEPRLRKPPLAYWIAAAAFRGAGSTESAFVARVPFAVAGTLLVLAVYAGGAWLVGRRRAFMGAGITAASLLFIRQARMASTEIVLGLFVLLGVFAVYRAITGRRKLWAWIAFGVCAGLGFLAKGPAAPAIPLAAGAVFCLASKPHRRALADWRILAGLACFFLIAVPWYLAVGSHLHAQQATQAAIQSELTETFEGLDHRGPVFYYLYQLPWALMPWGLLLPFAVWALWRDGRRHRGTRFLLSWFVSSFAIVSLVPNKQIHYALLLVPQAALAIGLFLARRGPPGRGWEQRLARGYVTALLAVAAAGGIALAAAAIGFRALATGAALAAGIAVFGLAVAALLMRPFRPLERRVWAGGFILAIAVAANAFALDTVLHDDDLFAAFARRARPALESSPRVFAVGAERATLEFYLHRRLTLAAGFPAAWAEAAPGDAVIVCGSRANDPALRDLPPGAMLDMRKMRSRCLLFVRPGNGATADRPDPQTAR